MQGNSSKIVGYGVCGGGEHRRYLKNTLDEFKRLCDETIILGNNLEPEDRKMIEDYGFKLVDDNREWGKNQHKIKEDFVKNHVSKLNPDWCVCLDMDEVFGDNVTRDSILEMEDICESVYVFICNLWNSGWKKDWSFWNIRIWKWKDDLDFKSQPLHCGLAPAWTYYYGVYGPFILKHYGLKEKKDRMAKVKRYNKYDPNAQYKDKSYYDALKTDDCQDWNESEIQQIIKDEYIQKNKPINKKIAYMNKKEKQYAMTWEDGLIIRVPEGQIFEHKQRGFKLIGEEPVKPQESFIGGQPPVSEPPAPTSLDEEVSRAEKEAERLEVSTPSESNGDTVTDDAPADSETPSNEEVNPLECSICGFVAKSSAGLSRHSKKHE